MAHLRQTDIKQFKQLQRTFCSGDEIKKNIFQDILH